MLGFSHAFQQSMRSPVSYADTFEKANRVRVSLTLFTVSKYQKFPHNQGVTAVIAQQ
jgi:hypothetical protein